MGQTPLELVEGLYVRHCRSENPDISLSGKMRLEDRSSESFMRADHEHNVEEAAVVRTWRACEDAKRRSGEGRRKLISVSEVAKRLAERKKTERAKQDRIDEGKEEENKVRGDEVDKWL